MAILINGHIFTLSFLHLPLLLTFQFDITPVPTRMSSILQHHSTTKQNGTAIYHFLTHFSSYMAELSSSTEGIWYLLLGRGRPWPVGTVSA